MLQPLPDPPRAPRDYTPTGAELWSYDQAWGPDVVTALKARHCVQRCGRLLSLRFRGPWPWL